MSLLLAALLVFGVLNYAESCFTIRQFDECGCISPLDLTFDSIDLLAPPGARENYTDGTLHPAHNYYGDPIDGKSQCNLFSSGCLVEGDTYIELISYYTPAEIEFSIYWLGWYGSECVCNQTDHRWYINGALLTVDDRRHGCYRPNNHTTVSK